jgi:hypothetical protein
MLKAFEVGDFPLNAPEVINRQGLNFTAGVCLRIDKREQAAQLIDAKAKLTAAQDEAQAAR